MESMAENLDEKTSTSDLQDVLRRLPSVDTLINTPEVADLIEEYGRPLSVAGARTILENWRLCISSSISDIPDDGQLIVELGSWLKGVVAPTLQPVINATGVIVHTNLGRAPLSSQAIKSTMDAASSYSNLEYDLDQGSRGSRSVHAEDLLVRLTGAEAALVVNNNAAAVLLMLTTLCQGKDVLISRGQLIEIGGGFRIPDVLRQSGARLVEVGTTNKTHLHDYERAIGENTGAILVAHHSNFKVVGFASEPSLAELADLAKTAGIHLLFDQGSGALLDVEPYGLESDPTVQEGLSSGADIIAFSGDKLLGGPQAGILCGSKNLITAMKGHPLARAVRADKLCLAALSATLNSLVTGRATREIPIWQMIATPLDELDAKANDWVKQLAMNGIDADVIDGESTVGGGSLPGSSIPTRVVAIASGNPDHLAKLLRSSDPPVIGRIAKDQMLLDPRTVLPGQEQDLLRVVGECAGNG